MPAAVARAASSGCESDAKGGVRLAKSADEAFANAQEILGSTLVTYQTWTERVKKVNAPAISRRASDIASGNSTSEHPGRPIETSRPVAIDRL